MGLYLYHQCTDLTPPAAGASTVACLADAVAPTPPTVT